MKIGCQSVLILAAISVILISGATFAQAEEKHILVYGSALFAQVIQDLGKEFMNEHPDVRLKVLGKTSDSGIHALLNREADLVMATREPNAIERSLAERKRVQWTGLQVAWADMAVICHRGASVSELTVDQLRKIFTGEYTNWRDVGGADLPIRPHSLRYPEDDTALWFADNILSKAEFLSGMQWVNTPAFLVQHVNVHAGSVAYLANLQLSEILKRHPRWKVQVPSIRRDALSPALSPTAELRQKKDYPLSIPFFLFWNENDPDKRIE